ncbi:MAG: BREX system P-loop protein BrxC [Chloroflexi bacterium]|nr:BREX system P-loop protein BrxC [Chloroflexota bacterium]
MKNQDVYLKDPLSFDLLNNGVSKVAEIGEDQEQLKTLRFELETFVCDGEYARGLERILTAYLGGLNKPEQQAVWVSGFFGSGKSHLVKMLRYLWVDFKFPDGASARSIAQLPQTISDLLVELTNRARPFGGLRAAGGTLGAGSMDNVRLAFLQLLFRAAGLPENLAAARFSLWLREKPIWEQVAAQLKARNLNPDREIQNFYVSTPLAEALVAADPTYGTPQQARAALREQFPTKDSPTIDDTLDIIRRIFGDEDRLPCTLLVVDEVQQYIGDRMLQRAMDVQEIAEHCCLGLKSRLLLVGTGQSALTTTDSLRRLQARFTVKVSLSDADVENVIRKTVLAKKPERVPAIQQIIADNQGEISRQLQSTRLAATSADETYYAADYPLLPVRRRFWEKVLRNVDASGTTAQLRTQLKIVFDAARETAGKPLGSVVPADFIYDQISSDLLNTGVLQREYHEIIMGVRDRTPAGALKSRLCALAFLIPHLPRSGGADDGVRATAETLADLLVEDLRQDGPRLRQEVPKLLGELVAEGKLMQVEDEYVLQTREGADWNSDFNRRRTGILNDESGLSFKRDELLSAALEQSLRLLSLAHGASRQARDLEVVLSQSRPEQPAQKLVLWMRHGWAEQEKTVAGEARAAGSESSLLFGFLPRVMHEELRQNLASLMAAQETLNTKGTPTSSEGVQACEAIKTRLQLAEQSVGQGIRQVLAGAKVFLGGGNEANGIELVDKVKDAATGALQRLFPRFAEADHANWPQVLNGARSGNVGALQAVGYQGETVGHPVCKQIYGFIGPGKKGKEVRDQFKGAPFGWPQDAIDAALVILTLAGNLRAALNGQPVDAKSLNQTQISNALFQADVPPLTVTQRLELKALFQKLGVTTTNGQEAVAAATFLAKLLELAEGAGGDSPCPARPDTQPIRDLQGLSGNAQLLAIHQQKEALTERMVQWTKAREGIGKRLPRWRRLEELHALAVELPEAGEVGDSIAAIRASRSLLTDPEVVPQLTQKILGALREALNKVQENLVSAFQQQKARLEASPAWPPLKEEQRQALVAQFGLQAPPGIAVADEEQVLGTLRGNSLANRRTLVEALPQRFQKALEEAARLVEPKAVRVTLPSATLRTEQDLDTWLEGVRKVVKDQLREGPVML